MKRFVFLLALVTLGGASTSAAAETPVPSWAELLDSSAEDALRADARDALVAKAREALQQPPVKRVHALADVGTHRTWLDGRSRALEDEIRETFALAMSDFAACNMLAGELPLLAAGYRLTGEEAFRDRVVAQLEEMAGWSPLQRPGWTLYTPGNRLPEDGKDGNWLATGTGVRAIGDALGLMPEDAIPDGLRDRLRILLESEIAGVVDDWGTKRPWFVRSDNAITNQWVLPTEGLVRACLITGVAEHREAYELGVTNLLQALNAHGPGGEFEEGIGYASFTMTSLLHAAHAMAAEGDRRAIDHAFLQNFPTWLVHHFQPGDVLINCFDAGGAQKAGEHMRPLLSLLAVCTGSPVARWGLAHLACGFSTDLAGLAAQGMPPVGMEEAPTLFAQYERAARVNWRDNWEEDGTGVWVRGGHGLDQHDHQDRGHVNFIAKGRPILIEAGTPSYHHKLMMTHYTTGAGHNVLQVGTAFPDGGADAGKLVKLPGWQKAGGVAPITVRRLDEEGGEVIVDASACYDEASRWMRTVRWEGTRLTVTDEVTLPAGSVEVILFRWHLGTEEAASITEEGQAFSITWSDTDMTVSGSAPLAVSQRNMPDHTLAGHNGGEDSGNVHTCVVVQTVGKTEMLRLETSIELK